MGGILVFLHFDSVKKGACSKIFLNDKENEKLGTRRKVERLAHVS